MLYYSMPALAAGFILDLMIGDPRWLYHPVCLIGNLIAFLEKILRKIFPKTDKGELAAGIVEVILVCLLSGGIPFLILHILYGISVWAGFALETFWCYQLLATKSLKTESMKVYDRLKNGTLDEARYAVSMIVGRDTQSLTEEGECFRRCYSTDALYGNRRSVADVSLQRNQYHGFHAGL